MACTTVDCLPPSTCREKIGRPLLLNSFGFRQLRERRLETGGLCPITLHFSRPLIGGRQATVVQLLFGLRLQRTSSVFLLNESKFWSYIFIAQLKELRKQTFAKMICENMDSLDTIQPRAFLLRRSAVDAR